MSSNNPDSTTTRGILELARSDLTTLGEELDNLSGIRVVSASKILAEMMPSLEDWDFSEACDEVRFACGDDIGRDLAAEGSESGYVRPYWESYARISTAYGADWARLAYADYLAHFCDVPCEAPYEVASGVWAKAQASYQVVTAKVSA